MNKNSAAICKTALTDYSIIITDEVAILILK